MASKDIRYIIKCKINFQDGNCDPAEVDRGEILDVSEHQYSRLLSSGPKHFELIRQDFRVPEGTVIERPATPEKEIFDTPDYGEDISQEQYGVENFVEWKPVPWYAAQLARKPASEEA